MTAQLEVYTDTYCSIAGERYRSIDFHDDIFHYQYRFQDIYEYLNYVLSEIPKHMNGSDLSFIDGLLPWSETLPAVYRV